MVNFDKLFDLLLLFLYYMCGFIIFYWGYRDKFVYYGGQRFIYGVFYVVNLRWYGVFFDINVDKILDLCMY